MTAARARAAEVALVALTVVAAATARAPADGAGFRLMFAAACVASAAVAWTYARQATPTAGRVLGLALLMRAIAFPLAPTLSDDAYRYVWDGVAQAAGHNPYEHRPADEALSGFHGEPIYGRLNSAEYYSVYPPASQLAFRIAGQAYEGGWRSTYYLVKGIMVAAEGAALAILLRLAAPGAVALYALSPLAVMEVSGQGHTEGLAVLGLVVAAWGVARRRGAWAGAGIALAGGAKLLPFALTPFATRRAGAAVAIAAVLLAIAMTVPYAAPGVAENVAQSLALYVRSFEFAAGPYMALKAAGAWLGFGDVSKVLGPALGVAFAGGVGILWWWDRRSGWSFATATSAVYALFFATATTLHPWYLLPALAVAPLLRRPGAWFWAAAVAPVTYLFYTGPTAAYTTAVWAGWIGAALIAMREPAADLALRRRARWKWRWIASALGDVPAGTTLLDVGAAEGYVGACAAAAGADVTLVDVVDANRTRLPHVVFDGHALPHADASVDVVLLVFVLHHARDPAGLLAEANRVARRAVVIVETVPEPERRRLTEAVDRLANRLRPRSLRDDERWLHMRPAAYWRRLIAECSSEPVSERRRGGAVHPQALFVIRPSKGSATRTPPAGETT